jgi:glycosyltransferase involved in cell wall biosynthesis
MKIVMLCNEYPPAPHGGIGTFVQIMARALAQRGHGVRVLGTGPRDELQRDGDVAVQTVSERYWAGRFQVLTNRLRLLRALQRVTRETKADIVETPDYSGLLPFRLTQCPVVVRLQLSHTTISHYSSAPIDPLIRWCERRTLALYPNWIAVSRHALDLTTQTFSLSPRLNDVIYYPIDTTKSAPPPPKLPARFVLFGGSVTARKGALVLATAANRFLTANSDLHLVYAGPVTAEIQEEIAIITSNQSDRIHFTGPLSRGAFLECIRRCEVFAFPSTLETFGLVVAEAMQCSKPVVTSNIAPFTEFVQHNQTGLLVDPLDASQVADAVETLVNDRRIAEGLSVAGRAFIAEHFTVEQAVAKTLAFYEQVLREWRR